MRQNKTEKRKTSVFQAPVMEVKHTAIKILHEQVFLSGNLRFLALWPCRRQAGLMRKSTSNKLYLMIRKHHHLGHLVFPQTLNKFWGRLNRIFACNKQFRQRFYHLFQFTADLSDLSDQSSVMHQFNNGNNLKILIKKPRYHKSSTLSY